MSDHRPPPRNNATTLWFGDIDETMDETFLAQSFQLMNESITFIKLIRDKATGQPLGYGFLGFPDETSTQRFLQRYNGQRIPNSSYGKCWKLNTAGKPARGHSSYGNHDSGHQGHHGGPRTPHFAQNENEWTVFVGFLSFDVDDMELQEAFRALYPSTSSAKVILDPEGKSKGFGFVRFSDINDYQKALAPGAEPPKVGQKPVRVSQAQPRAQRGGYQNGGSGDNWRSRPKHGYANHRSSGEESPGPVAYQTQEGAGGYGGEPAGGQHATFGAPYYFQQPAEVQQVPGYPPHYGSAAPNAQYGYYQAGAYQWSPGSADYYAATPTGAEAWATGGQHFEADGAEQGNQASPNPQSMVREFNEMPDQMGRPQNDFYGRSQFFAST